MDTKEKTLLLQIILEDLRGSWSFPQARASRALELAKELKLTNHAERVEQYFKNGSEYGDWDGRHFRVDKEYGGYYGMDELHGLTKTLKDKSLEFQKEAEDLLEYPEYRFEDVTND